MSPNNVGDGDLAHNPRYGGVAMYEELDDDKQDCAALGFDQTGCTSSLDFDPACVLSDLGVRYSRLGADVLEWLNPVDKIRRTRMSAEERKIRHREIQRQFMKRKRARIAELRKIMTVILQKLRYVELAHECKSLRLENERLSMECEDVASRHLSGSGVFNFNDGLVQYQSEASIASNALCHESSSQEDFCWDEILDYLPQSEDLWSSEIDSFPSN